MVAPTVDVRNQERLRLFAMSRSGRSGTIRLYREGSRFKNAAVSALRHQSMSAYDEGESKSE